MEPVDLLHDWLATSTLRPSTRAEYQREVSSFVTWCARQDPAVDALTPRLQDIADWSHDLYLAPYLDGRPFNGPDALGYLATKHPEAARSHDRRITALTQYYDAAFARGLTAAPLNLAALRSGVHRPAGAKNRLTPRERAVLLHATGGWGPQRSKFWQRDQLVVYLLLEGLRPAQVVRLDVRHLYPQPDGTTEVRSPDDHENTGKKYTLDPLTGAALHRYLEVRPEPSDGTHALLLSRLREQLNHWWPGRLVQEIAATHPLLADRKDPETGEALPPVTADAIAHTGLWDTPGD
ncbi:hypothetical protein [Streptomyces sp. NPDC059916]|uniref:hypothetical protein n=1 Tax=Streptomyces sp. NPDC059916 TaxID=3347001 RepID=UPI0036927325